MVSRAAFGIDPITLEVIRGGIISLCEEMGIAMERASYSPIFSEALDYSFALFDGKGEMVAQAAFDPVHLGAMPHSVKMTLKAIGYENVEPGDVLVNNDPYVGGTHCTDFAVLKPIFVKGEMIAIVAARAHMIDIGASTAGALGGDSTEIHQEGLRLPGVKLVQRGEEVRDIWRIITTNVRVPTSVSGDMRAILGSLNLAVGRIENYVNKYGINAWNLALERIKDLSEVVVRREIAKIPKGSYLYEDYMDDSGNSNQPIRIRVKVTVKESSDLIVDFSGSSKQVEGPINCPYAVTLSNTYIGMLHCLPIHGEYQLNEGTFRPVTVIAPAGSIVNAQYPAPVQGGNTETAIRIVDTIIGALSQAVDRRNVKAACYGTSDGVAGGGIYPDTKEPWVMILWTLGGMGARYGLDGNPAQMPFATNNKNQVVEINETRFPILTESYRLSSPDTCGAGQFRGGMGTVLAWRLVAPEVKISGLADRYKISPYGVFGGLPPAPSECSHFSDCRITPKGSNGAKHATDFAEARNSPSKWSNITVHEGDLVELVHPGGGGYGDPLQRDPSAVTWDVLNKYVTKEAARSVYGVVLTADLKVDEQATLILRQEIRDGMQRSPIEDRMKSLSLLASFVMERDFLPRFMRAVETTEGIVKFQTEDSDRVAYVRLVAEDLGTLRQLTNKLGKNSGTSLHTIHYFPKLLLESGFP